MELCFPILTEVLSTPIPTQLFHEILFVESTSFIFVKIDAAVPDSGPKIYSESFSDIKQTCLAKFTRGQAHVQ